MIKLKFAINASYKNLQFQPYKKWLKHVKHATHRGNHNFEDLFYVSLNVQKLCLCLLSLSLQFLHFKSLKSQLLIDPCRLLKKSIFSIKVNGLFFKENNGTKFIAFIDYQSLVYPLYCCKISMYIMQKNCGFLEEKQQELS